MAVEEARSWWLGFWEKGPFMGWSVLRQPTAAFPELVWYGFGVADSPVTTYAVQLFATPRHASPRAVSHRQPPGGFGPHTPPLSFRLIGGLIVHHLRLAPLRMAPHRQPPAPVTGGTPSPAAGA
jgi:hypothetical protein